MALLKKILINVSNLNAGGGLQVALSFINETINDKKNNDYELAFALSKGVFSELSSHVIDKINFVLFETSPTKVMSFNERARLDKMVLDFSPDIVFSIFGPTYWKPKNTLHFVGFAQAWLLFANRRIYGRLSKKAAIKRVLLNIFQLYSFNKHADYIVSESSAVARAAQKKLKLNGDKSFVVSNTASSYFFEKEHSVDVLNKLPAKDPNSFYFLLLASAYPHKNIEVIKRLLALTPDNYIFIITTQDEFYHCHFSNTHRVLNVGFVKNKECPALYKYSDAVFLPTLLECFSANYPEAFAMNKPVFTSDLDFAVGICQDAAFYFDPYCAKSIANSLKLIENESLVIKKTSKGRERLKDFLTAKNRMQSYFDIMDKIIEGSNL